MTYKEFKNTVLNYFQEHSFIKRKVLQKALKFKKPTPIATRLCIYEVDFQFRTIGLTLNYCLGNWKLSFQKNLETCNIGRTINDCCDYLWKLKE